MVPYIWQFFILVTVGGIAHHDDRSPVIWCAVYLVQYIVLRALLDIPVLPWFIAVLLTLVLMHVTAIIRGEREQAEYIGTRARTRRLATRLLHRMPDRTLDRLFATYGDHAQRRLDTWRRRHAALQHTLGPTDGAVYCHQVGDGWYPALLAFPEFIDGIVLSTALLITEGERDSLKALLRTRGDAELVICIREEAMPVSLESLRHWAADVLLGLVIEFPATTPLKEGVMLLGFEMDGSNIAAALLVDFDLAGRVRLGEASYGLTLCLCITAEEVRYADLHGTPALLERLRSSGVYPYSARRREPVVV
ncbi:MAG: suppressor of fused domain protein [Phycisphaerales bacterium]|nr:suppressor of fused domain protein [Phycisphaerales bacterium]